MYENDLSEVLRIEPSDVPFDLDDKIFYPCTDDCEYNCSCEPFSYNDCLKKLENISGINQELMGPK